MIVRSFLFRFLTLPQMILLHRFIVALLILTIPYIAGLRAFRECVETLTPKQHLRVAAHRLRNFLLTVAMHDFYYCILTGASPLQHKGQSTCRRRRSLILEQIWRKYRGLVIKLCSTFLERCGKLELRNLVH